MEYKQPYGLRTVYFNPEGLHDKCKNIEKITHETYTIIDGMKYIMEEYGGTGIAAPQIGEPLRLFMVSEPFLVCINPTILKKFGGVDVKEEGCLSIPGFFVKVPRNRKVLLHWYDVEGKPHEEKFSGMTARIIQHEYDHLDGLLIDRYEE